MKRLALALGCGIAVLGAAWPALAVEPIEALADQLDGGLTPALVQLIALVTVLAVVPSLLIMATSFTCALGNIRFMRSTSFANSG